MNCGIFLKLCELCVTVRKVANTVSETCVSWLHKRSAIKARTGSLSKHAVFTKRNGQGLLFTPMCPSHNVYGSIAFWEMHDLWLINRV